MASWQSPSVGSSAGLTKSCRSLSEQQPDPAVVLADRTGPDPDQIPGRAECVEVGLAVVGHAHGQHVALEYRCRDRRSLQDGQHIDQAIDTSARCSHTLPPRQEAGERVTLDGLDFLAQRCQ